MLRMPHLKLRAPLTSAASNMGDSVFSMFGGGAKKEKKEEDEDRGDVSGSAKAQKEAAAEENPDVGLPPDTLQIIINAKSFRIGRGT